MQIENRSDVGLSADSPDPIKRVLVITKFRGVNIGNQGLTVELIDALSELTNGVACKYVGRSSGLNAFTLNTLKRDKNPLDRFENWAKSLCDSVKQSENENRDGTGEWQDDPELARRRTEVFRAETTTGRLDPVRRRIFKPAKIMVNRYLRRSRSYAARLNAIKLADVVIYNGAGELGEHDLFVHQMLQLRVAQLMGKKVVPINQSVQLRDPMSLQIVGRVYSNADSIYVRGEPSKQRLIENGVDVNRIHIAPDLVYGTSRPEQTHVDRVRAEEGLGERSVGLCLTDQRAESVGEWKFLIDHLRNSGREPVFVSNSPNPDIAVGRRLEREFGVRVATPRYDYLDFAALLANFEFVISSRLHTCILSNVTGVPAIPIDSRSRKLSETYDFLPAYPLKTVNVYEDGWQDVLKQQLEALAGGGDTIRAAVRDATESAAKSSMANVSWLSDD